MYIIAYDFGTGGIKASLYGADGACVASGFDAYETTYPASGFHEQSPEDWWRATVRSTRLLAEQAGDEKMKRVRALGISGHSLGVVPLDAAGNLLRPTVPIWSDSRAGAEAQAFFREVPEEAWYMKTGNGFPAALYSVFKLMWFRAHEPEWFGRAATILGTKDYINYRLCGVRATDFSYASGTGVYDLAARRYDEAAFASLLASASCSSVQCTDDYGDYGTVGFVAVSRADDGVAELREFVMSCRVAKKLCEQSVVLFLAERAAAQGATLFRAVVTPTGRNGALVEAFDAMPFSMHEADGRRVYELDLSNPARWRDVVRHPVEATA